jgi:hypothetical protein
MTTKIKFLLFTFFLSLESLCNFDLAAQGIGKVGIKGGLNASKIYVPNASEGNALIGFHGGLYGQFLSSRVFAIQSELLFSARGDNVQYIEQANQEIKYNLNYIDLPVLAVIKLGDAGEIHLGGYVSYLLNATISYEPTLGSGLTRIGKDDLTSYDYGLSGGLGLNVGNFQIGARYNLGLVSLSNSSVANVLLGDARTSCAQFFVSMNLRSRTE